MNREEHVIHHTCHERLVAAGHEERRRARPSGSARRVREVGEREEPVSDRPVLGRRDLQERGPSGRARQRALVRAAQAPHRVLVDGDVAAPAAVEAVEGLRRRRAVDGDLQAADDGAEEQREQDQAAVGLAGAPLDHKVFPEESIGLVETARAHRAWREKPKEMLNSGEETGLELGG